MAVVRIGVGVAASIVILGCIATLALFFFAESRAERYTAGTPPIQFFRQLDGDLLDDYSRVYGVAHNSGNSVSTTRSALLAGADVIEVDVVMAGSKLYAGHDSPLPFIGQRFFRGPTLTQIWEASAGHAVIKLDLKESSSGYLDRVARFLETHDDGRQVLISSRSLSSLQFFEHRLPYVIRLLSVPNQRTLDRVKYDPAIQQAIDGISLRHTLLDDASAHWLEDHGFVVLAWTVNDAARMNELVRLGVDAITTDNLAILELLGGQVRNDGGLVRR